jgi:hypothetical protein
MPDLAHITISYNDIYFQWARIFPGTQVPGRPSPRLSRGPRPLGFDHPGLEQFCRVTRRSILISFSQLKD